jgi:hypothetical protein
MQCKENAFAHSHPHSHRRQTYRTQNAIAARNARRRHRTKYSKRYRAGSGSDHATVERIGSTAVQDGSCCRAKFSRSFERSSRSKTGYGTAAVRSHPDWISSQPESCELSGNGIIMSEPDLIRHTSVLECLIKIDPSPCWRRYRPVYVIIWRARRHRSNRKVENGSTS